MIYTLIRIVRWWRYNNPQEFLDTAQLDIKRAFNSRFPNSVLNFVFKIGFRKVNLLTACNFKF